LCWIDNRWAIVANITNTIVIAIVLLVSIDCVGTVVASISNAITYFFEKKIIF
jgi:hypothetical protein